MSRIYHPGDKELMEIAWCGLRKGALHPLPGPIAPKAGGADAHGVKSACEERRMRSLRTCHRPAHELAERKAFRDSGAYVPETAARIDDDPNLTDGARRCARKIMEETYRRNREGRKLSITVSYLANALGKCRRSVQRYLRQLEEGGYVGIAVAAGQRSRLCVGIVIRLLAPLFPHHHQEKWPDRKWTGNAAKPGATRESQNHRVKVLIPRNEWAVRCMDGVFRSLMKITPPFGLPESYPS